MPFVRAASARAEVTVLARPHAAPLLARFAPGVIHIPLTAPWTAFTGKYRLCRWPWRELTRTLRTVRGGRFDLGVSARRDPRDHALLALGGARRRIGFPRSGSQVLLTESLPAPAHAHRAEHWRALATALQLAWPEPFPAPQTGRRVVIHTGAGHPVRRWPADRYVDLATRLRKAGWEVILLEDFEQDFDGLIDTLAGADRFIGNDSGPGHLAALLGVPTFTVFGPQLPELFAPRHPQAAWIEGSPCPYKPCFDKCRFAEPSCITEVTVDAVWQKIRAWSQNANSPQ